MQTKQTANGWEFVPETSTEQAHLDWLASTFSYAQRMTHVETKPQNQPQEPIYGSGGTRAE